MSVLAYKSQERLSGCEMESPAAVRVTFVWQSWDKGCLLQEMGGTKHDGLASKTAFSSPAVAQLWVDGHERKTNTGMNTPTRRLVSQRLFFQGRERIVILKFWVRRHKEGQ